VINGGRLAKKMTKSLPVSKRMVYESYLKVVMKNGGAGIDRQSIEMFNADMPGNLYKLWNRMTSGSYFPPPVRTVFIPKKQGGLRPLGIPTVSDRIAQGVVKDYLEPMFESIFHPSSFGYRPCRSAHDALAQCRTNCMNHAWVIDVDIKGFFDNISHDKMIKLLELHTKEKWILMYIERWLKAGVEQADGSIAPREKGTPQGGVISPLLANVYLHYALDRWMAKNYPANPFERYADDIVIHCNSKDEAQYVLAQLEQRMQVFDLTLHPEKTKIVYCKNYYRKEKHEHESFTFLSYSFQPRRKRDNFGRGNKTYIVFAPAISAKAKTSIREAIRNVMPRRWSTQTLEGFAEKLNPKIRGWINYYTKFYRQEALSVFCYLNGRIMMWMRNKYKIYSKRKLLDKLQIVQRETPYLFYHWKQGIKSGFR
jgi:RNA-directed DNA polymerase